MTTRERTTAVTPIIFSAGGARRAGDNEKKLPLNWNIAHHPASTAYTLIHLATAPTVRRCRPRRSVRVCVCVCVRGPVLRGVFRCVSAAFRVCVVVPRTGRLTTRERTILENTTVRWPAQTRHLVDFCAAARSVPCLTCSVSFGQNGKLATVCRRMRLPLNMNIAHHPASTGYTLTQLTSYGSTRRRL